MRVEKVGKEKPRLAVLPVADGVSVLVEKNGRFYRVYHRDKLVAAVGGKFIEWCFFVDEFKVCLTREELEVMFGEHQDQRGP
jgi:hypothetical protein